MPTRDELTMLQHLPLEVKVAKTQQRIREWVNFYGKDGVYISFSGGKDSTVLLHLVRGLYGNDIPAVFVNTGLEFPEIQSFVKTFENVEILRPKMGFSDVISKYGYPLISKEIAETIYQYRIGYKSRIVKFDVNGEYIKKYGAKYDYSKWIPLRDSNIPISHMCCIVMKKTPVKAYEKSASKTPILGTLVEESILRQTSWMKNGCNGFNNKRPISQPLSFWTEQDVLQYIKENSIQICPVYGDIVSIDEGKNEYESSLFETGKLKTTGCQRTGCLFCGFGCHSRNDTRFLDLKKTHPKQYAYCMNGGEFVDGIWKPNKEGLGMKYVFDRVNEIYGKDFIRYE